MATREEIYTAIRNADAVGDSAAVRKLGAYLQTLPQEGALAPGASSNPQDVPGSPENRALHAQRLKTAEEDLARETGIGKKLKDFAGDVLDFGKGAADLSLTLGAQAVMTPLAGIGGAVTAPFGGSDAAANVVRKIQGVAYEPKSEIGRESVATFSKPFEYVAGKADSAGQVVSDATGSPALGTALSTAIQGAPAFLARGARAPFASAARGVVDTVKSVVPQQGTPAAAATGATQAQSAATAAAAANAETYARTVGLDWAGLADSVRAKLTDIARTAGELEKLDPQALKRYATLQGLKVPVPATRGALTRDTGQLLNEDVAKADTTAGRPIVDIQNAGDTALQANLDVLRGRVAGRGKAGASATNAEEAGGTVQGAARAKEAAGEANYKRLYKAARETEPNAAASIEPVAALLKTNPEIQHLGWLQSWLKKTNSLRGAADQQTTPLAAVKLSELQDLRSLASEIARTGGKEGHYAGQVMRAIDESMESVPEGAKAWKAARNAFREHKLEFNDQRAVGKLVDDKTRTDRIGALEKTVDTIANGSLESIRQVKRTLLTGGDEATRTAGKKAWREVRVQVVDRIKREATKSAQEKADGTNKLSVAKLKQVIDSYGPDKLNEIFGPGSAKEVGRILEAARIVKYAPESLGSNTANKLLAFLGKGLGKLEQIPFAGKVVGGAVDLAKGFGKVKEAGANARIAEKAATVPLNEALGAAKSKAKSADRRQKLGGLKTSPLSSLSAGASQQ